MNYRQALIAITLAGGLGACASSPDYGLRYQDGSYYSPAGEGRGDYYVGVEPQRSYYLYDDFDLFFDGGYGWYGSPFYSHGGYCSVRYRYCPRWAWGSGYGSPYGETGFQLYFGSPRDPYWGRDYYPPPPYRHGRRPPPPQSGLGGTQPPQWPNTQDPQDPTKEPRGKRPRPSWGDDGDGDGYPASRKVRAPFAFPRSSEPLPPPRSTSGKGKSKGDGDGN